MGPAGWALGVVSGSRAALPARASGSRPSGNMGTHKRVIYGKALRTARDATTERSPREGGFREEWVSRLTLKRKKGLEAAQMKSPGGTKRRSSSARTPGRGRCDSVL